MTAVVSWPSGDVCTAEVVAVDAAGQRRSVIIPIERPLTLYLDRQEIVTLMTLGQFPQDLALGYLRNQRLLADFSEVQLTQVDWEVGAVAVTTNRTGGTPQSLGRRTITSGCGQGTAFGDLQSALQPLSGNAILEAGTLQQLLANLQRQPSIYQQAGAVHGCALADDAGAVLHFVEDVGRHNAVDAIAGWMWRQNITGADKLFYTTGRLTSEMVMKCVQMGIPILISRSGLTRMGHALAEQLRLLLIGRCHGRHYLAFTGTERIRR